MGVLKWPEAMLQLGFGAEELQALRSIDIHTLMLQGVFVDSEGYVAEGSVMNIGIVTQEGELVVPPFEQALPGCTLQRLLHLVSEVRPARLQAPMHQEEAKYIGLSCFCWQHKTGESGLLPHDSAAASHLTYQVGKGGMAACVCTHS